MLCVSWHGPGEYDRFIVLNDAEMQAVVNHYGTPAAKPWGYEDHHYYLVNEERRVLAPLKKLAMAFGGQWNGYPPYGDEAPCHFSLSVLSEYRLEECREKGW